MYSVINVTKIARKGERRSNAGDIRNCSITWAKWRPHRARERRGKTMGKKTFSGAESKEGDPPVVLVSGKRELYK